MLRYILRRLLLLIRCCSPPQPSSFCCCGSAPATRRWIIYVCRTCRPLKRWLPRPASCWGSTSRWQCSICTGYGGRCTGFRSLLCHPAPGAGRPAALPAGHPAAHRRGAGADPRHLPAVGHLGGAPSRSPAGLYRTADCLPRRLNAQLLAGLSAGDALFRASAVAPGDGVWRLAAPDIARRLHRLYVAGDQRPPAARQHAGRRQPASRDMGAAARIERAPWSADISCAMPPCRW